MGVDGVEEVGDGRTWDSSEIWEFGGQEGKKRPMQQLVYTREIKI